MLGTSFASKMGAACVLALFWQQCGWLAHDFAHHGVFTNRRLNDLMVLLVGGFYLGFSLDWWKNKCVSMRRRWRQRRERGGGRV